MGYVENLLLLYLLLILLKLMGGDFFLDKRQIDLSNSFYSLKL